MLCIIWKSRIGCFIRRVNTNKDIGVLVKFLLHYLPFFLKNGCINDNYAMSILLLGHSLLGLKIRAQKLFFGVFLVNIAPKRQNGTFFFGLGVQHIRGPLIWQAQGSHQVWAHLDLKCPRNVPRRGFFFNFIVVTSIIKNLGRGSFWRAIFSPQIDNFPPPLK